MQTRLWLKLSCGDEEGVQDTVRRAAPNLSSHGRCTHVARGPAGPGLAEDLNKFWIK